MIIKMPEIKDEKTKFGIVSTVDWGIPYIYGTESKMYISDDNIRSSIKKLLDSMVGAIVTEGKDVHGKFIQAHSTIAKYFFSQFLEKENLIKLYQRMINNKNYTITDSIKPEHIDKLTKAEETQYQDRERAEGRVGENRIRVPAGMENLVLPLIERLKSEGFSKTIGGITVLVRADKKVIVDRINGLVIEIDKGKIIETMDLKEAKKS